ncbi:MAG: hypothetical protein L0F87_02635 [Lactococcus sp.]|nr:hypothetical protein [Lactococcus sp.]MDN5409236.1 hypothetical protein [Lactococcus sp.]MDN5461135.1 hypothetical protein [Lactococcus sp.]MDN5983649.1 hypothetical protein [Lactococcus sp.]MDN6012652.1 hypothetical protein [Lactococcus sp.]MDN6106421.1 hypothetical protein [Lactococcus sp.]
MRTLFYEDIQNLSHEETQALITWYERWCLKESRFLVGHKNQITPSIRQDSSELVLFSDLFVADGDTLDEIEANLKEHGYVLRHKKNDEQTGQMNVSLIWMNGKSAISGRVIECYTLLDYNLFLYEKDKTFSDADFLELIGGHNIDRRHQLEDSSFNPDIDGQYRLLFYEDIEEISTDDYEALLPWYQARADELNEYYVVEREKLIEKQKTGIYRYGDGELNSLIHYTPHQVTCETQEDLALALEPYGYKFKHKETGERTEQRTAKLLKVVESSKTGETKKFRYAFLGFKEEIRPVTELSQRFDG